MDIKILTVAQNNTNPISYFNNTNSITLPKYIFKLQIQVTILFVLLNASIVNLINYYDTVKFFN